MNVLVSVISLFAASTGTAVPITMAADSPIVASFTTLSFISSLFLSFPLSGRISGRTAGGNLIFYFRHLGSFRRYVRQMFPSRSAAGVCGVFPFIYSMENHAFNCERTGILPIPIPFLNGYSQSFTGPVRRFYLSFCPF